MNISHLSPSGGPRYKNYGTEETPSYSIEEICQCHHLDVSAVVAILVATETITDKSIKFVDLVGVAAITYLFTTSAGAELYNKALVQTTARSIAAICETVTNSFQGPPTPRRARRFLRRKK